MTSSTCHGPGAALPYPPDHHAIVLDPASGLPAPVRATNVHPGARPRGAITLPASGITLIRAAAEASLCPPSRLSQQLLQPHRRVGPVVAVLHDHRGVERDPHRLPWAARNRT